MSIQRAGCGSGACETTRDRGGAVSMLIDTHCHLDALEFATDRDALVCEARNVGVSGIVIPAVEPDSFASVLACCRSASADGLKCYPAYGIHPLYLEALDGSALPALRRWLESEMLGEQPPVAVGEIGLDYFVPGFDAQRQEEFLVAQLKIARDFDLPVLLHSRRAVDQVLKCLRRVRVKGGIAHAFSGSLVQAEAFMQLGFKLGCGGAMTFAGSTRIRRLAAELPLENLVLETDAPDIPPAWLNGARNTPAELLGIAKVLAELRGLDLAALIKTTTDNAKSVFGLP